MITQVFYVIERPEDMKRILFERDIWFSTLYSTQEEASDNKLDTEVVYKIEISLYA